MSELEAGAWREDWSYGYLEALFRRAAEARTMRTLAEAPAALDAQEAALFVRHDVDVSLGRAVRLAERERAWGVRATYHVMLSSPFYDVSSREGRDALDTLRALGHEVGIHIQPTAEADGPPSGFADVLVARACDRFEQSYGHAIRSISFHVPAPALMSGPLFVADRVNAYAAPLLAWYLSDSRGRWREGEPVASLARPRAPHLQLLVHPLWWGESNEVPERRLAHLAQEIASARGEPYETTAESLYRHIVVRPAPASEARP